MKFSSVVIFAIAAATDEKKVPPRHPLQRLTKLTEFSEELLADWFTFLPSQARWINKFAKNAERMRTKFQRGNQRCGYYDENNLPHGGPERRRREVDDELNSERYNRTDPKEGVKQITTGFRKWAERYISRCSGQRNYQHQVNRMNLWNDKLQKHLDSQN